jgi:hypothetical protein
MWESGKSVTQMLASDESLLKINPQLSEVEQIEE